MTLLEMLVVIGLIGLLIALVARFFAPFMRNVSRGLDRVEMQQQGMVALNKIRERLQASAVEGISYRASSPVTLSINRLMVQPAGEIVDATGNLRWRTDLDLFVWQASTSQLRTRTWPPAVSGDPLSLSGIDITSPLVPKKPTSDQLQSLAANLQTTTTLATGVVDFSVTNTGPGGELRMPLQLRIKLQRNQDKVEVLRSVFLAGVQ